MSFGQAEPVAWAIYWSAGKYSVHFEKATAEEIASRLEEWHEIKPLYADPQPDRVAELERERDEWIECHARVYREKWQLAKQVERLTQDAERLDFVLERTAFVVTTQSDAGTACYQLLEQDADEEYIVLSGEGRFFATPRAAIDAALAARADSKMEGGERA